MAQPFDSKAFRAIGEMFPVAERVETTGNNAFGAFSVSGNGTLIYRKLDNVARRQLVWFDRAGKRTGAVGKPREFVQFSISPDEKTLALAISDGVKGDIWLQDLQRDVLTRFTFREGVSAWPVWSPDGADLIFGFRALGLLSRAVLFCRRKFKMVSSK